MCLAHVKGYVSISAAAHRNIHRYPPVAVYESINSVFDTPCGHRPSSKRVVCVLGCQPTFLLIASFCCSSLNFFPIKSAFVLLLLQTIGGRLRSGEWHDISRRTIKLMNQLVEERAKGRKDASPPHHPLSSKSVDKAHGSLSLGPSREETQGQTDSPSSLERVARNSAENSKAPVSAKSVDAMRVCLRGGMPEHQLYAGEDRQILPSSTNDLARPRLLSLLPSSGSSCLPRSSSLSSSETPDSATSRTRSSPLLLVPVPPPQPRQSPPLGMKLFLQDIEAAVGCAFGVVFLGLLSRRSGGEALLSDAGKASGNILDVYVNLF